MRSVLLAAVMLVQLTSEQTVAEIALQVAEQGVDVARSAYLLGGVVLPRFRGLGLYRALVGARLKHAASHGLELAISQAREVTSAPILERMGCRTICRFPCSPAEHDRAREAT